MNIQDRVTVNNVYIKPDGEICACIVPVPEEPKPETYGYTVGSNWTAWYTDNSNSSKSKYYKRAYKKYEAALQACKDSSVRFEDQESIKDFMWRHDERINNPIPKLFWWERMIKPDTFYPLQCEVYILTGCEKCGAPYLIEPIRCQNSYCERSKVARLIPEANCELDHEEFTCCKCGGKFKHTQGTWLPIGVEDKQPITDTGVEYPSVLQLDLRKPEIITSKDFTCYDCTPDVPEAPVTLLTEKEFNSPENQNRDNAIVGYRAAPIVEESQDSLWMSILTEASVTIETIGVSALIRTFKERYHITRKP